MEFFVFDLSADDFMCRGCCGSWDAFHKYLYMGSNLFVAAAYILIPAQILIALVPLLWRWNRGDVAAITLHRPDVVRVVIPWVFFFIFCSGTHGIENFGAFYWPSYRFFAWWAFFQAWVAVWGWVASVRFSSVVVSDVLTGVDG